MALLEQSFALAVAVGSFAPTSEKFKGIVCYPEFWPSLARVTAQDLNIYFVATVAFFSNLIQSRSIDVGFLKHGLNL